MFKPKVSRRQNHENYPECKELRFQLCSVAEQAGLNLTWSLSPKIGFLVGLLIWAFLREKEIRQGCTKIYLLSYFDKL